MGRLYDIPNKLVYVWNWVLWILFLVWFFTYEKHIAIFTGILGMSYYIFAFIKPQLQPKSKILFPDYVPNEFFYWTQRLTSIIMGIVSIFVLFNYRITNSMEIGALIITIGGLYLLVSIFFIINFWKGANSLSRLFITLGLIVVLFLVIIGIFMIIHKSEVNILKYAGPPYIIPVAIGVLLSAIILVFGDKKIW